MHALACRPVSLCLPASPRPGRSPKGGTSTSRPPRDEDRLEVEHLVPGAARKGRVSQDEVFAAPLAAGS